jgi:hypothetical protein
MQLLAFVFVFFLVAFTVIGIAVRKRRSNASAIMRSYLQQTHAQPALRNIPMSYRWKKSFNIGPTGTVSCDIYIQPDHILIAPDENFPVWGTAAPVLFTADVLKLQQAFPYITPYKPRRVSLNVERRKIEIEYSNSYVQFILTLHQLPLDYFHIFNQL